MPPSRSPVIRSIPPGFILLFGVLAASTSSIFIRFAQSEAHPLIIAFNRMIIATAFLLPWAWARHRKDLRSLTVRQWVYTALSGVFLGAHFGTWISSLAYTNVTSSVVLVQTTPIFVMLLSPFLLKEKMSLWGLVGLGCALLGGAVVALSDSCLPPGLYECIGSLAIEDSTALKGDLLSLAGAVTGALYLVIGRMARRTLSLIPYITLIYGIAALLLFGTVWLARLPLVGYSPSTYLWFVLLAIFPQLIAHSSYNWALRVLPAAHVSLSLLGEPVGAAALAYIILGEALPALRLFGALVVILGIAIALLGPGIRAHADPEIDTIVE